MEDHETQAIESDIDRDFEWMPASECVERADLAPRASLLGDLWHEGEIAFFFGDTATGKSVFAAQVAEAIARGEPIEPFEMTSEPRKVLFLDLGQSSKQFARRYTREGDEPAEEGEDANKTYQFSPNMIRVSLKRSVQIAPAKLGPLIERTGAKVLIIDSLAYLQRYSLPRETAIVMRELRRLRNRYDLSILVLLNTSRSVQMRGIVAADIPCSAVVTSFADSIFAVGRSGSRSAVRYIKQIKNSVDDISYGAAHVPYFAVLPKGGNFPSFHHIGYAGELVLRAQDNGHWEWQRIRNIKQKADENKSVRDIANELQMTKTTVHRLLQMAGDAPPLPSPGAYVEEKVQEFYGMERCIVNECRGCRKCDGRAARDYSGIPGTVIDGHSENTCPDDCDMCGPRRYKEDDTQTDPQLKAASDDHYDALREWLLSDKAGDKPLYPGARRYGHELACWFPGSENWTQEQLEYYDRWRRTHWRTHEPQPNFNPRAGP